MKFSKLLASLTAAGALALAGQAAAFAPVWPTDGDTAAGVDPAGSVVLWHSGASASTISMQSAVISSFCSTPGAVGDTQPIDVLEASGFWAVACLIKGPAPTGFTAGDKLLWNKRDEGGSGVGVGPLATGTAVGFMKPSTGAGTNCPATGAVVHALDPTKPASLPDNPIVTHWHCTGFAIPASFSEADPATDGVSRVPDIGTSDIEPSKFTSSFDENVTASDLDLDGFPGPSLPIHDATGLTVKSLGQLIFNTPVNVRMYLDLQQAQFPTGHPLFADCNPAGATYGNITAATYDSDGDGFADPLPGAAAAGVPLTGGILDSRNNANKEKCMPSLMANEIRSTMARGLQGAIRSAIDVQAETSYGSGGYAPLSAIARGASDDTIHICRRVKGSGTQAQFNAILLGYPCDPTFDGLIDTLLPAEVGRVTLNEGSGDVETCLDAYNDGTVNSTNPTGLKRWAIGVQSLEKNVPSTTTFTYGKDYRFIKIDGFAPTLVNAHAGDYFDVAQQTIQHHGAAPALTVDAIAGLEPALTDPLLLAKLPKGTGSCIHGFGRSCWLATPSATVTPDPELDFVRPVAWFLRVASTGPNTCALPSAFRKAGSPGVDITVGPQNCSAGENTDGDQNCYTP